jgi:hypothetical protein
MALTQPLTEMNTRNLPGGKWMPAYKTAIFSKGVHHMAINVFNGLPDTLMINDNDPKKFKANFKDFFCI